MDKKLFMKLAAIDVVLHIVAFGIAMLTATPKG